MPEDVRRHAELLTELYGQDKGGRDFRKHVAWYLKGFAVGSATRRGLGLTSSLAELDALIAGIDAAQQYLPEAAVKPRGRTSGQRKVALPEGWLNSESIADSETLTLREAELSVSGG